MFTKNIKINSAIILFYSLLFLSINSTPYDIYFFFNSKFTFVTAINFIRSILPFIIIFFFLLLISYNYFLKKKLASNIIIIFFSIFILLQIIGFLLNPKIYQNLYEYKLIFQTYKNINIINTFIFFDQNYYLISLFSILLFYLIITSHYQSFKIDYLLIVSVILLSIYNMPTAIFSYKNFLLSEYFSTYATDVTKPSTTFFNVPVPRSTGVARSVFIIYIFINIYLFYKYNRKNTNKLLIVNIILGSLIWSFQSRIVLALKLIIDALAISFLNKNLLSKIKLFLFITLTPIIIHNAIIFSKNEASRALYLDELKKLIELKHWNNSDNKILEQNRILHNTTSGRTEIWNEILLKSKNSLTFGYGSQADRWHINRNDPGLNNASSALFYSLICGGILGVIIYILIVINCIRILFIYYKKNIQLSNETIFSRISFFIIISLLLRSIVENSFMFFGVDNMLFLTSYFVLVQQIKKNR